MKKNSKKPSDQGPSRPSPKQAGADASKNQVLLSRHYHTLRDMAQRILRSKRKSGNSRVNQDMSPTSLVAESTLHILAQRGQIQSQEHLHALVNISMQRILSDRHRRSLAQKRTGKPRHDDAANSLPDPMKAADIHKAVEALRQVRPRQADVVTLVALQGMTVVKAASTLKLSVPTVNRDLRAAREWLARRLG